ncbi:MAG: hypothetical protein M3336_04720, partial [Chloroflexota bacterium]|nr:hypothetical protein [Chloroflexota bacterium]
MQGTLLHGRRRLALGSVAGLFAIVAALSVLPVWADADVRMVEGSATDINSWAFSPAEVTIQAGQS